MQSLYEQGLSLLHERKLRFVNEFIPYFFMSYACHCFNLMNIKRGIYHEHGPVPDSRLHLLFCAPPGFSKSLFMRHCFDPDYGILWSNAIPSTFELSCTEAGWTGSLSGDRDAPIKSLGLAEEYATGVVSIEEFRGITMALQQEHSLAFEAQLNASLFGGHVRKRMKAGSISYDTCVSLIAGTQITRFDISAGLGRRFNYIYWVPTPEDFKELREGLWEGDNVPLDMAGLVTFRTNLNNWIRDLESIERVRYTDAFRKFLNGRPHFEQLIYRKEALGYTLFKLSKLPREVLVDIDPELERLLTVNFRWREELLGDPQGSQVMDILRAHNNRMHHTDLQLELLKYSVNFETAGHIIDRLIVNRMIRHNYKTGELQIA